jgi:ParB family chromosome partitioning protein
MAEDKRYTKLLSDHLLNAKGFFDYGVDRGLTTPESTRLTIIKRQQEAKRLVNSGMSQRKAAKALGVDKRTIGRDVGQNAPQSGAKIPTPTSRELTGQSENTDWRTPRKYLEAARAVMGAIDLDPASSADANEIVKAEKFFTDADDGLQQPWAGRVWLNPPFGGKARDFIDRLVREYEVGNVIAALALINAHASETKWFQQLFNYTICFVAGRIEFWGPHREIASTNTCGSVIVYLGEDFNKFYDNFSVFGSVVRRVIRNDANDQARDFHHNGELLDSLPSA